MTQFFEDEEDRSFIQRYRGLVTIAIILLVGAGVFLTIKILSGKNVGSSSRQTDTVRIVMPPPPPPPPKPVPTPPPQKAEPTPDQKPEEQQKMVDQPMVKPDEKEPPKDKPPDAPAPLGTSISGPGGGPDLGLGSGLGGGGGYGSGGGGGGSKYGWYANGVSQRVQQAILGNARTRKSSMNVTVYVWPDSTGRITKVRVSGPAADPAQKAALENEVLNGLQLSQPPPADMPLPIVMKIDARRPN